MHSSGIRQSECCKVGEGNDEDQVVPSVMKLIEKLTDEEVDEMILETDVDDAQSSEQLADVSLPQIADRIVEVVTAFHGNDSRNESLRRSSTCRHTQSGGEDRERFSPPQQVANEQDAKIVSRQDPTVNQ